MTPAQPSHPMKDSGIEWVGKVPAYWSVRPFYSFATEVDHPNAGLKERNLLSLSYGRLVRKDMDRLEGLTPASFEGYNIIEANDIVFRLTDLQNDQTSLRSARAKERGIITSAYVTVRPQTSPRFFEYLMRSYDTSKVFYGIGGGIRQSMKFADLKRIPVVVPPECEMDQIATHLDHATSRIDALVAKKTRFLELLREKCQALITHAVTKGLDAGVPMKDSGVEWLGEVPAHWPTSRLAMVFHEVARIGSSDLPVLSISIHDGISDDELKESERNRKVNHIEDKSKYKRVVPGDLAYNMMRAWQGAFGAVNVTGQVSPAYVVAEPKIPINTTYVELLLRTSMAIEEMRRFSRGIADFRSRLYWEHFRDVRVCLPPIEEQGKIVSKVAASTTRINTLIAKTERSIELLREHRTALITAAVTGKIDLRNVA